MRSRSHRPALCACTAAALLCAAAHAQTPARTPAAHGAVAELPEVLVDSGATPGAPLEAAGHAAPTRALDATQLTPATRLDETLVDQGWAQWDANNSFGLGQGLQIRGFTFNNQTLSQLQANRTQLNGHADIAWRFMRDPATLETVQLQAGGEATLAGASSPAGNLLLTTKAPTGTPFSTLRTGARSSGGLTLGLDAERHFGPLQARLVLSGLSSDQTIDGVQNRHHAALLSARLPLASGSHLQLDLEEHRNHMPYSFGTVYAGGRWWLGDQGYVDGSQSSARRIHRRLALYWQQRLNDHWSLRAHWQNAHVQRNETLMGFWDIHPRLPLTLRGYARNVDETYRQHDGGIALTGQWSTPGGARHRWTLAWLRHEQKRDFAGPQSMAGFNIDLENPVYPALTSLKFAPRYAFETYRENGLGLVWQTRYDGWQWQAGLRQSRFEALSSTSLRLQQTTTASHSALTHSLSLSRQLPHDQRIWLSYAQAFMPNRGQFSNGQWLPPSRSHQWDIGWAIQTPGPRPLQVSASLFELQQSNLPARDPAHPDAYLLLGDNRSRGLELGAQFFTGALHWRGAGTVMHARVQTPTQARQGRYLIGVADRFASLRVDAPLAALSTAAPITAWARWRAVASRPSDSQASTRAPGYAVADIGIQGQCNTQLRWNAQIGNLFNRRYVRALSGIDNVWQGPTRTLQVGLEYDLARAGP